MFLYVPDCVGLFDGFIRADFKLVKTPVWQLHPRYLKKTWTKNKDLIVLLCVSIELEKYGF